MKIKLLIPFILVANICFAQLRIGANPGYYGSFYTDQAIYNLMSAAGCSFTRSTVDIKSAQSPYNYQTYLTRLQYQYNSVGFRNSVFFATVNPYNGTYTGQSTYTTPVNHNRSWIPNGIYLPAFNSDSSINQNNIWAVYIDSIMVNYGAYFNFLQIWNEPDFSYTSDAYLDSAQDGTSWQKREPLPDDLPNMNDSLEKYVQLCKIAKQVCNHVKPSMKVITGGLGYTWFYMWCIRKGITQWIDGIDFHEYPFYQWVYCVWNSQTSTCGTVNGDNGAHRNSDVAATRVDSAMRMYRMIETQEGATHIPLSSTEIAIPRWSIPATASSNPFPNNQGFGSNDVQQNFIIKSVILCMRDTLLFYTMYQTGEDATFGNASSGNPFVAMGLDTNMTTAGGVGHELLTPQGRSFVAMQTLLKNYTINYTAPSLVAGTTGAELDSSTYKMYVVWAICTHDTIESAVGTFVLPAGQTYTQFDRNGALVSATVTGTVSLSGAPIFLRQNTSGNTPPTVSAGANQSLTANNGTLTGTASAGSGSLTSTTWSQLSGPNTATITTPSSLTTTITGLITGTYVFQLSATNSNSLTTTSQVTVTVTISPLAPTAIITPSSTVIQLPLDSVSLNGASSHDNNSGGTIQSYKWTQTSGAAATIRLASGTSTYVVMPTAGAYGFQLVVTNNAGIPSAPVQVTITVNSAVLVAPTALIVPPTGIITLPVSTVVLNGTGSSAVAPATISSYQWQLLSVPGGSPATIQAPNASITNLVNAIPGTYTVRLTVRDTNNLTGTTTATFTVNSNLLIGSHKIVKSIH